MTEIDYKELRQLIESNSKLRVFVLDDEDESKRQPVNIDESYVYADSDSLYLKVLDKDGYKWRGYPLEKGEFGLGPELGIRVFVDYDTATKITGNQYQR